MKTYYVTVGTRNRVTVPYDAWMDARCATLKFKTPSNGVVTYDPGVCMQRNMSYRFTLPIGENVKPGDRLEMIPDATNRMLILRRVA